MAWSRSALFFKVIFLFCLSFGYGEDVIDVIGSKVNQFSPTENVDCSIISQVDLVLPQDSVSHIPRQVTADTWLKNRTSLQQLYNMALNRALFYSFVMQKMNSSADFNRQPDWTYVSMATVADIHANEGIFNASAIYYDNNVYYPNWLKSVSFNRTISLFGAKAYHSYSIDNTRETWSGVVEDMGAGSDTNYTRRQYKMSLWYNAWLPDNALNFDSVYNKEAYSVGIKYAVSPGVFSTNDFVTYSFFIPYEKHGNLVKFTKPYFDCSSSERWVVSAAAPIVDYLARYSPWAYLRRARFVGVAVFDVEFKNIDINQCDLSYGNPPPNRFAGTHKCETTTTCWPVSGYGFERGGYTCHCDIGYHYPPMVKGPFKGMDLERANITERENNFRCIRTENTSDIYELENVTSSGIAKRSIFSSVFDQGIVGSIMSSVRTRRNVNSDQHAESKEIFDKVKNVTGDTCGGYQKSELALTKDYAYGVEMRFDNQARTALRLAHFLSNHLQNVVHEETFDYYFVAGRRLPIDSIFGEVLANVMSDNNILSSGVYFEPNAFQNWDSTERQMFGPFAFSRQNQYFALDTAGLQTNYTTEKFYETLSSRWRGNISGLTRYKMESFIRSDKQGTNKTKHPHFPMEYMAPTVTHGVWSQPRFKCDGQVDDWVITYSVPFFGIDTQRNDLMFKGVVTVDVPLKELDVNQCPQPSDVPNAFKNSALCDYRSTDCVPVSGYKYTSGGYKCVCKKGFEYQWNDTIGWFYGTMVEQEYRLKMDGNTMNIFDRLGCRRTEIPSFFPSQESTPKPGPISFSPDFRPPPLLIFLTLCLLWIIMK